MSIDVGLTYRITTNAAARDDAMNSREFGAADVSKSGQTSALLFRETTAPPPPPVFRARETSIVVVCVSREALVAGAKNERSRREISFP